MSKYKMTESVSGNASASAPAMETVSSQTAATADVPIQDQLPTYIDVHVSSIHSGGSLLARASLTLNGCFAVKGIKIVQGVNGPFVSMPSRKVEGDYRDICFPCTKEFREQLHATVLEAYQQELEQMAQRSQELPEPQQAMG